VTSRRRSFAESRPAGARDPARAEDCYALLGLVSFFTVGDDEVRAWSIPQQTRAQDAAGAVHSDNCAGLHPRRGDRLRGS